MCHLYKCVTKKVCSVFLFYKSVISIIYSLILTVLSILYDELLFTVFDRDNVALKKFNRIFKDFDLGAHLYDYLTRRISYRQVEYIHQ